MMRTYHKTGNKPLSELQLATSAYYVDISGGTGTTAGLEVTTDSYTVEASIEIPSAPTPGPIRVTFSASNTGTVPAASGLFLSDAVPASSFGLANIPAGTELYVKLHMVIALNGVWSINSDVPLVSTNAENGYLAPSASTSQVMNAGLLTLPASGASSTVRPPLIGILGKAYGSMPAMIVGQTSIANWQNDNQGVGNTSGGFVARAAYSLNGYPLPWAKLTTGGSTYAALVASGAKRALMYPYANIFMMDGPTNDVFFSRTLLQIEGDMQTVWGRIKAAVPTAKIVTSNIIPRTTSTDSWATEANQTPRTGFELNGIADQFNTWIATQAGTATFANVDVRSQVKGTDPNKWIAPGETTDGTHPGSPALVAMASVTRTALASAAGISLNAQSAVAVSTTGSAVNNTAQTAYTFSLANAVAGDVVVGIEGRVTGTTATLNSVTIGGVTAYKINEARNTTGSNLLTLSLWKAKIPAGGTVSVVVTFSGAMIRAGCVMFSVANSDGAVPANAAVSSGNSATGAVSASALTVPSNGAAVVFAGLLSVNTGTAAVAPTNYTTDLAPVSISSSTACFMTGGHDTTAGSRAYTATFTGDTPTAASIAAAAWGMP
jgi:hypothetical protein